MNISCNTYCEWKREKGRESGESKETDLNQFIANKVHSTSNIWQSSTMDKMKSYKIICSQSFFVNFLLRFFAQWFHCGPFHFVFLAIYFDWINKQQKHSTQALPFVFFHSLSLVVVYMLRMKSSLIYHKVTSFYMARWNDVINNTHIV